MTADLPLSVGSLVHLCTENALNLISLLRLTEVPGRLHRLHQGGKTY